MQTQLAPARRAGLAVLITVSIGAACASNSTPPGPSSDSIALLVEEPGACEPIEITTSEEPYPVAGSTPEQVRESMDQSRPASESGAHYDAVTRWKVRWAPNVMRRGSRCVLECIGVGIDLTLVLPHWEPPEGTDPAVTARWQAFVDNLRMHEDGHRTLAVDTARQIVIQTRALPPEQNCDPLEAAANARAESVVADYSLRHQTYDDETRHGQNQGATFP